MTVRERNIYLPIDRIEAFCRQNPILKLSLFGSVLRDDFTEKSDVDFLVELEPKARIGLFEFMRMQIDLEKIVGRPVDLRTPEDLHDASAQTSSLRHNRSMSTKTDADHLRDMLTYAEDGHALTENRSEDELDSDPALRYAIQYCILIIGEAASHVSEPTRSQLPAIPWQEIVGMRNWIVHGYLRIRAKTVWDTATQNLPRLIADILRFLPPEHS